LQQAHGSERLHRKSKGRTIWKEWSFDAKYICFAEGCRGHSVKQLIEQFKLESEAECPALTGLGIKELGILTRESHKPG